MRMSQGKSEKLNRASLFATNAWRLRLSIRKKYPNCFYLANTAISPLFRIDCIQFQLAGSHHCDQKLFSSFIMAVRALPRVNIRIFFQDLRSCLRS